MSLASRKIRSKFSMAGDRIGAHTIKCKHEPLSWHSLKKKEESSLEQLQRVEEHAKIVLAQYITLHSCFLAQC